MSVNEVKLKSAPEKFVVRGSGDPSGRTFCLGDEDHTLGNSLRHVLMQDSQVSFAGYSVPHPAEPIVQVRVQTAASATPTTGKVKQSQSQQPPPPAAIDRFKVACQTLHDQCNIILEKWESLIPEVKEDRIKMEQILLDSEAAYDDDDDENDNDNNNNYNNTSINVDAMEGVEETS